MIINVIMKANPCSFVVAKRVPVKSLRTQKGVALKKGSDALTKNLYSKRPRLCLPGWIK